MNNSYTDAQLRQKIKQQRTLIATSATTYQAEVYIEQLHRYESELKRRASAKRKPK